MDSLDGDTDSPRRRKSTISTSLNKLSGEQTLTSSHPVLNIETAAGLMGKDGADNGYKHWTAKCGTLIADLLVTAGKNIIFIILFIFYKKVPIILSQWTFMTHSIKDFLIFL